MTTDYAAICDRCKLIAHVGQRMGVSYSLSFGPSAPVGPVARFMLEHALCSSVGVRITVDPEGELADYRWIDLLDPEDATAGRPRFLLDSRCHHELAAENARSFIASADAPPPPDDDEASSDPPGEAD